MKIGRIIIAGVVITIVNAVIGAVMCGGLFNWVYQIEPTTVWKPMEGAPPAIYHVGALVAEIIFVMIYALFRAGIPGTNRWAKGFVYGLCIWAVSMLPGMLATYTFMNVAPTVIVYWTLLGLVVTPLKGLIAAGIYGD